MSFAHLLIHTEYSLHDALCTADSLFSRAAQSGISAIAITDSARMDGIPDFIRAARHYPSVKPVIGCEIPINDPERMEEGLCSFPLVLLAKDKTGYHNLMKIVSCAQNNNDTFGQPFINNQTLRMYSDGLVCLSGGNDGIIPQAILAGETDLVEKAVSWYHKVFGEDFYLEVMLHCPEDGPMGDDGGPLGKQVLCCQEIISLGERLGIKVVAANDVRFTLREDGTLFEKYVRTGLPEQSDTGTGFTGEEYLKSEDQMRALFPKHPEVIDNTMEIVGKIGAYNIWEPLELPVFPVPEKYDGKIRGWVRSEIIQAGAYDEDGMLRPDEYFISMFYLCHLSFKGARKRYGKELGDEVKRRLSQELKVICKRGFPDYFLIVQDYVGWARKNGILVGPGRGSTPGSLVAYCLGITEVDPLRHSLLFERFLNMSNHSVPDIDVDFDEDGRRKVIDYLVEKYGEQHVGFVKTFGTMPPFLPGYVDGLKNIVFRTGVNACAIIIGRKPLDEYLPLDIYKDRESGRRYLLSQYSCNSVSRAGVLQLDLIGVDALARMKKCLALVKERHHSSRVSLERIPLDDSATFALYGRGDTDGVFHFESPWMKRFLMELKPDRFEDLMAMEALYRPKSIHLIQEYIARKSGKQLIPRSSLVVKKMLAETYGLTVYQEQVMEIVQRVAGLTPEQADNARRALCRQDWDKIDDIRDLIVVKCRKDTRKEMDALWNSWGDQGSIIFNKSHAAAYALLSYWTAWLKTHYPDEFEEVARD